MDKDQGVIRCNAVGTVRHAIRSGVMPNTQDSDSRKSMELIDGQAWLALLEEVNLSENLVPDDFVATRKTA